MSWTLTGFNTLPLNYSAPRISYNQDSPGFRRGFKWTRKFHGDCMQMVFYANPSIVDFKVREIVQLVVDGEPQFMGIIVKHPGHLSRGAGLNDPDSMEEFIVYGLSYFLRETLIGDEYDGPGGTLTTAGNISALVRYIVSTHLADRVRYDSTYVPLTGDAFSEFYMPYYPVNQVMDALSQAIPPNTHYGVNQVGIFYFRAITEQHALNFSDVYLEWIPINAEEIVTAGTLIVSTEASPSIDALGGEVQIFIGSPITSHRYVPKPEIITYEDPVNHPIYRSRISRLMGNLLRADAKLVVFASGSISGFINSQYAHDDNPNTYTTGAAVNDALWAEIKHTYGPASYNASIGRRIVGCRIVYEHTNSSTVAELFVNFMRQVASGTSNWKNQTLINLRLPSTGAIDGTKKRTVDVILPTATIFGNTLPDTTQLSLRTTNASKVRIYEFVPIYKDLDLGVKIIQSLLRLPAQNPAVVTVSNQLLPPRKVLYIIGVPGFTSNLQGDVAEYEYTLSPEDGKMTQIKFEQPDLSDEVLIAKHMAQELDAKVIGQIRSDGTM